MAVDGVGGSPLDQLVAQYEAVKRRPIDELEYKKEVLNAKNTTYETLKTKTKALKDLSQKYKRTGALSEFGSKATTSSDEKVLTTSADATALDASHTIEVTQLAKSDTIISDQKTKTDTDVSTAVGAGLKQFDITVNGVTKNISLTLTGTETNEDLLSNIVTAINGTLDIKINAGIVND